MNVYLDTSTILRVLLRQRGTPRMWKPWTAAYSSEMLRVEARRVLDRLRLEAALDDEGLASAHEQLGRIERTIEFITLTPLVLQRASAAMPTIVKTLEAIHLASALLFQEYRDEPLIFATHDAKQATAAKALGFRCVG